ncbi:MULTISPECIES: acyl-CoA thioesterase [Erwiniaceae]|nr:MULTISPECIES: acyl-CoA thioesterase [Erwiniaceae]MCW1876825.1 acyl-CoA thioesterase [Erwinia sp. INIA01]
MAMTRYPYFASSHCLDGSAAPEPIEYSVKRIVRFDEVDSLEIVWHGHYASYFEDARVALGEHLGIGYSTLYREQVPAPIKQLFVNYHRPLAFAERCRIVARLHWSEAARMNMSYKIINTQGETVATGFSVQMFTLKSGEYLTQQPDFYAEFCQRWKLGQIPPLLSAGK